MSVKLFRLRICDGSVLFFSLEDFKVIAELYRTRRYVAMRPGTFDVVRYPEGGYIQENESVDDIATVDLVDQDKLLLTFPPGKGPADEERKHMQALHKAITGGFGVVFSGPPADDEPPSGKVN